MNRVSLSLLLSFGLTLACNGGSSKDTTSDQEDTSADQSDDTGTDDTDGGDQTDSGEDDTASDTDSDTGEDDTASDTGSDTGASDTGSGDTGSGNSVTGTYGADAVAPIQAAYWIGQPGNPSESGGGPFVYLFSAPVTCEDISVASWMDTIPAGTQVLEMIIGTTSPGTSVTVAGHAGADAAEVNYAMAGGGSETRASGGTVTVTAYTADTAVDGTIDVTFPQGTATGTFHATYCATGQEF